MNYTLFLPFPSKNLSPNKNLHHMALHRLKKKYKNDCMWKAKADGLGAIDADGLRITRTYFPPAAYRYDLDNLDASMKAATDAISAVVGIDDHKFTFGESKIEAPVKPFGMVKIELEWTEKGAKAA